MTMPPKPKRYTVEEAAEWLDMKVRTLRQRIQDGEIRVIPDGKRKLISEEELLRYDRERQVFAA